MSAQDDREIEREVVIDAPAHIVWATITEPQHIAAWFAEEVELELRPGGRGRFRFGSSSGGSGAPVPVLVEDVQPPERFAFRWARPGDATTDGHDTTLVEFTLVAEAPERTRLRVRETGVESTSWTPDARDHFVEEHRQGWAYHLGRLQILMARR